LTNAGTVFPENTFIVKGVPVLVHPLETVTVPEYTAIGAAAGTVNTIGDEGKALLVTSLKPAELADAS
jgi:hypothetical protein